MEISTKRFLVSLVALAVGSSPALSLAASRILLIGDSHTTGDISTAARASNSPGIRLDELLRKLDSVSVTTYGSCGAQAGTYLHGNPTTCGYFERDENHVLSVPYPESHSTPVIDGILASVKPDTTIIFMGTNYAVGYEDAGIRYSVESLTAKVKAANSKCIWVGPPAARQIRGLSQKDTQSRITALVQIISDAVKSDCDFIDSSQFASYPSTGGDGMHFSTLGSSGIALAGTWASLACAGVTEAISGISDPICSE